MITENIAILILAAGASERLGQPKQLLRYGEHTLLQHAIETALASSCRPVIVVLGAYAAQIHPQITASNVRVIVNEHWQEGMSVSIQRGLAAVQELAPENEGVILMVCDQPLVSASLLDRLVAAFRETGQPMAACMYDGEPGVPALFAPSMFSELEALCGAEGAKQILRKRQSEVACLPFPDGNLDIDTPEDYQALRR